MKINSKLLLVSRIIVGLTFIFSGFSFTYTYKLYSQGVVQKNKPHIFRILFTKLLLLNLDLPRLVFHQ